MRTRDVWENALWRRGVFAKDEYTCVICADKRGGNLEAHHLDGWAEFPEERFDLDNGVTLCVSCHRAFHRACGYGKNTRVQFENWRMSQDNTEVTA